MFGNKIFKNNKQILCNSITLGLRERRYSNVSMINLTKRNFNGLFERPTQSIITHLHVLGMIDSLKLIQSNLGISWAFSIAVLGSVIRLTQIPCYFLIKNIDFDKITPNFILNWRNKLFIQDFLVDAKKYNLSQIEQKDMIKSYETNFLLTWFYQIFLIFSNFKALNSICKYKLQNEPTASLNQQYINFENDIFGVNLVTHDSFFILPILVFGCNYTFLKTSIHPWLINYSLKNNKKLVYISLFVSLFSIVWPKCYCISWIAYCLTNIFLRLIVLKFQNIKANKSNYKFYASEHYKHTVKRFLGKNENNKK